MKHLRISFLISILFGYSIWSSDHGYGYLIRLLNQTQFNSTLDFPGRKPQVVAPGGILGEKIASSKHATISWLQNVNPTDWGRVKLGRLDNNPKVSGFGIQEVPSFTQGSILVINPLYGTGAAWLDKEVFPLNTTVQFKVKAPDRAEAHIVFGEKINKDSRWRIVLGAMNNTKTIIMKNGQVVAESSNLDFPEAILESGRYKPFWISVEGGIITVGVGAPGQTPVLIWKDDKPSARVKRIGFGSNIVQVRFTEIELGPPVKATRPERIFITSQQIPPEGITFREPGAGALSLIMPSGSNCVTTLHSIEHPDKYCKIEKRGEIIEIK
ncbi:hypothetical protein KAU11_05970, partial [Candidatus Babeliales bacterium]|nr:hypothetical protein [Candidatus Babeliales bacterium]